MHLQRSLTKSHWIICIYFYTTEMEYYIKNESWEVIYKNLKEEKGFQTKDEGKLRIFYEAVWYISRTGCQWRFVPMAYGEWRALHKRFLYWTRKCGSVYWRS